MKKFTILSLTILLVSAFSLSAQEEKKPGLNYVGKSASMRVVPSLSSRTLTPAEIMTEEPKDGRYVRNAKVEVVPNKDPQTINDFLARNPGKLQGKIDLTRNLENDFIVNNNVGSPSDPALAVGPDHVYIVFNTGLIIYDKDGNDLTGAFNVNNIFSNGGCCDLTVSYDSAAERWVLTYLFVGAGMELAVSDGPDPINSDWFVYSFPQINDYNKLSVWRDGYYITDNGPSDVWVIDRDAALAGDDDASIQGLVVNGISSPAGGFTSAQVLNVADDNMPTTGGAPLVFMRDDGFQGVTEDEIWIWTIDVDFDTPANSTVSAPEEFAVTPFINVFDGGSFANLTQPGGQDIDALQTTIMNQAQFRKFPSHNSAIFNFVVDTDASAGELAGIRWYEFRQDGDGMPWSLFQEGTYTAPDGKHAWNGSMSIDGQGNIGLGYTAMAGPDTPNPTANRVGAYYTGRFASDDAGVMSLEETLIGKATTDIVGLRYGDYGKMDIDPSNDKEFWFITEYTNTNHVAKFQIASDFENDIGVVSIDSPVDGVLTDSEDVTITIFNFGTADASDFEVSYQIDGGATVTETFDGTIEGGGNSAQYTFDAQGDFSNEGQTYAITASTIYDADEDNLNDEITANAQHLFGNDVGVTSLVAPISGSLGDEETIVIEITNFGSTTQTSIPVFYTINGGDAVEETYTGSIGGGDSDTYTFSETADLSELGEYNIDVSTDLDGDGDESNDLLNEQINNLICMPVSNCSGFNDGVTEITLADQEIDVECDGDSAGYSDNTDIIFNFVLDENPFDGTLQMGFADSIYALWIDFNDNNIFEPEELVSSEQVAVANSDFDFTIDFTDFAGVLTTGMHRMRLRGEDESTAGDVTDPCGDLAFGRTNDFTANITGSLGLNDADFGGTALQINYLPNDQYEVVFANNISFDQRLPITVYNTLGQKLAYYTIDNNGGAYRKTIDMSYVASGVYFVQVGDETLNKTKKIVVQ